MTETQSFRELKAEFDHKKGVNRSGGPISDAELRSLAESVCAAYEREGREIAKKFKRPFKPLSVTTLLR